nr:hypothetical protein BaRGS_025855 [Batillaria attramentaria]
MNRGGRGRELAIITRSARQSTVVVKQKSEFLSISVDDYHRIFMSGGVKSVNDPDHEMFVRSLPFLQGWPVERLQDEQAKCVFLYFKRGDVIVKDSMYSDWIIVVKSGSLAVLKKLRKVEAYEWRRSKAFTFVSDKEKRARQEKLTTFRKQVLPELGIPLKAHAPGGTAEDEQIRDEGKLRPFVHPDIPGELVHSDGDTKVWDLGSGGFDRDGIDHLSYVHVAQQQEIRSPRGQGQRGPRTFATEDHRPSTVGSVSVSEDDKKESLGRRTHKAAQESKFPAVEEAPEEHGVFKSDIRTIQQELDGDKKEPDDITAADLNPEFVHVQTLTKGMVFGLSDLILGQHTSFCVVSNGADVILVNKNLYHDHASEALLRRMRQDLCPYPSEEELQTRLQTSVDWNAYRQTTLADTLKSVRMRKQIRV